MQEELIVNCLHLSRREDREISILHEAVEQGFYMRFFDGVEIRTDRKQGVTIGHKNIIRDAKENSYKMCCVIEDDAKFFKSEDGKLAWDYFLEQIPDDFDIFQSMCYVCDLDKDNRITGLFSSLTMYVVHERFYDFFLSLPDSCFLDRHLGLYSKQFKFLVCPKFVCYQMGGKSDNSQMVIDDYSSYLIGRNIYGQAEQK